jgi:hypothetical protein
MMPNKNLTEGMSSSVMAILTNKIIYLNGDSTETFEDNYLLGGLEVALAHDPNYLKVKPTCIESTKRGGHNIEYVLHFQNTGAGPADTVIVTMSMPMGMNLKNFNNANISKAIYGGTDFTHNLQILTVDEASNSIVFKFDPSEITSNSVLLYGTNDCLIPTVDKKTMGDIVFSVETTDAADSVLSAFASIRFHSKYAGIGSAYEDSVNTNIATVRIKACCDCSKCNCVPPVCFKIAGLCWWWWVIIFLILTAIYILLRRRKNAAQC